MLPLTRDIFRRDRPPHLSAPSARATEPGGGGGGQTGQATTVRLERTWMVVVVDVFFFLMVHMYRSADLKKKEGKDIGSILSRAAVRHRLFWPQQLNLKETGWWRWWWLIMGHVLYMAPQFVRSTQRNKNKKRRQKKRCICESQKHLAHVFFFFTFKAFCVSSQKQISKTNEQRKTFNRPNMLQRDTQIVRTWSMHGQLLRWLGVFLFDTVD